MIRKLIALMGILVAMTGTAIANEQYDQFIYTSGCKLLNIFPNSLTTVTWDGACKDGWVDGEGKATWYIDKVKYQTYQGGMVAGRMNGTGAVEFYSGAKLKGTFSKGKAVGTVEFDYVSGDKYFGPWKEDHPEGIARVEYLTGETYQGPFIDLFAAKRKNSPALEMLTIEGSMLSGGYEIDGGYEMGELSPDGKHLLMNQFDKGDRNLFMIDTASLTGHTLMWGTWRDEGDYRVRKNPINAIWITNDLIAVDYGLESESINLKGKPVADLGEAIFRKTDVENSKSTRVWIFTDRKRHHLALADAKTGDLEKVELPSEGRPDHWTIDSNGVLRALTMWTSASTGNKAMVVNWYRPSANDAWIQLDQFSAIDDGWFPVGVSQEPDQLIVTSRNGRNNWSIFTYDVKTRRIGHALIEDSGADAAQIKLGVAGNLENIVFEGLKQSRRWYDPKWEMVQKLVDDALPRAQNEISGDPANKILVNSWSDVDPGTWYMLDMKSMKMSLVGRTYPGVYPEMMQNMETLDYPARDGQTIPAYLTRPRNATKNLPVVVMVHDGLGDRDHWGWYRDVQLLAMHGYAVFQPQFRGSYGFGKEFEHAGFRQWGLKIQDDISDGVEYLIKQGIADRNRICVYGHGYGGYTALWGLIKTPQLYRCAVSFAGVADLGQMVDVRNENDDNFMNEITLQQFGDAKQQRQQMNQVSPLLHADQIKSPVFLVHGEKDKIIPIEQSKKLGKALDENHKPYRSMWIENQGHELTDISSLTSYYAALFEFLDQNLRADGAIDRSINTH